ncbi:hypothetical protein D3C87_2010480 [compost metagenome]
MPPKRTSTGWPQPSKPLPSMTIEESGAPLAGMARISGMPAGTRVKSAVTSLLGSTVTVALPWASGTESKPGTCSW